jgi:hypothetical protein
LLCACENDLTPAWRLDEPELQGARVEVVGSRERSRPRAGEQFKLRLFVGTPHWKTEAKGRYSAQLELCLGIKLSNGQLACSEIKGVPTSISARTPPVVVNDDELDFEGLAVPPFLDNLPPPFDELDRIVLYGAVCVDGTAERVAEKHIDKDPVTELFRCTDNQDAAYADPMSFTLSVFLDRDGPDDTNTNPTFQCDDDASSSDACAAGVKHEHEPTVPGEIVLVHPAPAKEPEAERVVELWKELARPKGDEQDLPLIWEHCKGKDMPQVHEDDDDYTIRVRFDGQDRDEYAQKVDGKPTGESLHEELLVSHALTEHGGELERYFTVLDATLSDKDAEISVKYAPPEHSTKKNELVPADGRMVRFYFIVRDQRGGLDFTTRELCLLPRPSKG